MLFTTRQRNKIYSMHTYILRTFPCIYCCSISDMRWFLNKKWKILRARMDIQKGKRIMHDGIYARSIRSILGGTCSGSLLVWLFSKSYFNSKFITNLAQYYFASNRYAKYFGEYIYTSYIIQYTQISIPCRFVYRFFIF